MSTWLALAAGLLAFTLTVVLGWGGDLIALRIACMAAEVAKPTRLSIVHVFDVVDIGGLDDVAGRHYANDKAILRLSWRALHFSMRVRERERVGSNAL